MKIAFLGLGAMGSRMAMNLLNANYNLTVWNRSAEAASAFVEAGATLFETPAEAVAEADIVISMVRDDVASAHVWLDPLVGALAAMKADAIGIESSTLSPDWIKKLGQSFAAKGLPLVEAPVSGSRPQAEAGQLIFIVGGDVKIAEQVTPVLSEMGSVIHHVGDLGSAALVKLSTNTLLGVQVAVIAELIGMLKRNGVDPARAFSVISQTAVCSPYAAGASSGMIAGKFEPLFTTDLVAKDFRYASKAAGDEANAPTMNAALQVFEAGIKEGLAWQNLTSVVTLFDK